MKWKSPLELKAKAYYDKEEEEKDILEHDDFDDGTLTKSKKKTLVVKDKSSKGAGRSLQTVLREPVKFPPNVRNTRVTTAEQFFTRKKSSDNKTSHHCSSDHMSSENLSDISDYYDEKNDETLSGSKKNGTVASPRKKMKKTRQMMNGSDDSSDDDSSMLNTQLWENNKRFEQKIEREKLRLTERQAALDLKNSVVSQHVKNQIKLWSGLLAMRIQLQRILVPAGKFPLLEAYSTYPKLEEAKKKVCDVLVGLHELQHASISNNEEVERYLKKHGDEKKESAVDSITEQCMFRKKRKYEREKQVESCGESRKENDCWELVNRVPSLMIPWCVTVANEWHSRTVIPIRRSFKALDQNPGAQTARIMDVDLPRLIERALPNRDTGRGDSLYEVYEDTDFYVHLLRSTLSGGGQLPEHLSMETIAANNFSKKIKQQDELQWRRAVERRASKGRKLRYTPIPELLGFMNPVPQEFGTELLSSTVEHSEDARNLVNVMMASLFQEN